VIPLEVGELRGLGALWSRSDWITGVEIDSRRVGADDLFVAIGGGRAYLDDARANGASATLVPDDAFAAMAAIGRAVRARSSARVVGITGSTGKTSTKDILAALCRRVARTVAAEGGHNNEIGLPLTLTRIEPDTEVVICEMGMRGLGHIRDLAEIARPHVAIITSIGPVHLELLGTVEAVARAKAEILEALPRGGVAIVPERAPELEPFIPNGLDVRRFSSREAEVRGGRAYVRAGGREVAFEFNARHQATNAAAALVALDALGLPFPDEPVEVAFSRWRCEESDLPGGGLLINDAYNANPISMRAALEHLVARADGRRTVAMLGEMAELGPDAARFHEEIGALARELGVDLVVGVGELARAYEPDEWVADAAEAAAVVPRLVAPGDAIVVKGSRAVGLEVVAETLAGAAVAP
jgi:UDP-N-acetylmuramoyl-tripeptide--D-alanyl-D-alanine ligase